MAVFLFDMDGLLLDTEREAWKAFQTASAELGITSRGDDAFFRSLVGSSTAMTRESLSGYLPGHVGTDSFVEIWDRAMEDRMNAFVPLRPFVREVLERLTTDGHRLAVVTSTYGNRARHHLENAGILGFFEKVTGGDEVSANKPDPAPYRETAEAMGVQAEDCYAFEDSDRGIASAVAAGCKAVQIPDLRPDDVPLPALGQGVATNLDEAVRLAMTL